MSFLVFFVILFDLICNICNAQTQLNWGTSYTETPVLQDNDQFYQCRDGYIINGFTRVGGNGLSALNAFECNQPSGIFGTDCQNIDFSFSEATWRKCPTNYFLAGLYKNPTNDNLGSIGLGICCRPLAEYETQQGSQIINDWSSLFDGVGTHYVQANTYMTGIYYGNGGQIYNLERVSSRYLVLTTVAAPTPSPTKKPTSRPTSTTTKLPSVSPTVKPTGITLNPTIKPSSNPSNKPTGITLDPTKTPSLKPTINPTNIPTVNPTVTPSLLPSISPTVIPTKSPFAGPTMTPSKSPSVNPSETPTTYPSETPSQYPTEPPTIYPSKIPSLQPTINPTSIPSFTPTNAPSLDTNIRSSNDDDKRKGPQNSIVLLLVIIIILLLVFGVFGIWYCVYLKRKLKHHVGISSSVNKQLKQPLLISDEFHVDQSILPGNTQTKNGEGAPNENDNPLIDNAPINTTFPSSVGENPVIPLQMNDDEALPLQTKGKSTLKD